MPESLSTERVLAALVALNIPYRWAGEVRSIRQVGSLLCLEPDTLYYYAGADPDHLVNVVDAVVVCKADNALESEKRSYIVVKQDPQVVFYKLCAHLFGGRPEEGVHPTAVVHPEAIIALGVHIGAYCVVGRASIGRGSVLGPHTVVNDNCRIGAGVVIEPHGAVGVSGAVWMWDEHGDRVTLPQVGSVVIEDDAFIGAHTAIVRGLFNEATTIGRGARLSPGCMIGHGVVLGPGCHLANNVSIAGSAHIGAQSFLGSGCNVRSHVRLAERTTVGNGAAVVENIMEPGVVIAGVPARPLPASTKSRKGVPRKPEH
jgi:UDP-3-O-[3-hydroxymyristoyl] glucosamine N-acyltransferase